MNPSTRPTSLQTELAIHTTIRKPYKLHLVPRRDRQPHKHHHCHSLWTPITNNPHSQPISLFILNTSSAQDIPISHKSAMHIASLLLDQNLQPLPNVEISHHHNLFS